LSGWVPEKKVAKNKMEKFNWIIGSWKMETKRGIIIETWISTDDSTLSGESVRVNLTGGTDLLETVRIVNRNKEYFYIPTAKGQNEDRPVIFKITSADKSGFVAENPEHDFPKRISYQLISEDSIHAIIDAGPAMPEKKSDFYFSRFKN
jgi:hypothetical protein